MSLLAIAALLAPTAGAVIASIFRSRDLRRFLRIAFAVIGLIVTIAWTHELDLLSSLFAILVSALCVLATAFSTSIFPTTVEAIDPWSRRPVYFMLLGAFWSCMLVVVGSTTFLGVWIGISATTVATTFLVGYSGGKAALEAAWKYLILCTYGIGIALLGMLLLGHAAIDAGIAPSDALSWSVLGAHASGFTSATARVALVLMIVGFATKAGLVPMHAWLPDAHSKAPAPISAVLSGLLVSCALYAIMRVQAFAGMTTAAASAVDGALLVLGSISILVAAVLMLAQSDIKRLLSYSTVEHAGLVAIALGCASPLGTLAAIYHVINHASAKSLAFLSVGILQHNHGTTAIGGLRHVWQRGAPGKLFLGALVGLAGLPPFGLFLSELLIVAAAVAAHQWIALGCALAGMLLAFAALCRLAITVEAGSERKHSKPAEGARRAPRIALIVTSLAASAALVIAIVPFVAWSQGFTRAAASVVLK